MSDTTLLIQFKDKTFVNLDDISAVQEETVYPWTPGCEDSEPHRNLHIWLKNSGTKIIISDFTIKEFEETLLKATKR